MLSKSRGLKGSLLLQQIMVIPSRAIPFLTRLRGIFHREVLIRLSDWYMWYCHYRGIPCPSIDNPDIYILPFNTLLKWTTRVREEEALSLSVAHSLGLPVPRLISYGNDGSYGSIWMARINGELLSQVWSSLSDIDQITIVNEVDECLLRLRQFPNPAAPCISSVLGTSIKSFRAPSGIIPPCQNEAEFLQYLLSGCDPALWADGRPKYDADTEKVTEISSTPHLAVFAHGDLFRHNILVHEGHLSGIVDWECAGWLPEYWDYTTMTVRAYSIATDWNNAIYAAPGFKYAQELDADYTLVLATQLSFPL